jgi:hypothetical protein
MTWQDLGARVAALPEQARSALPELRLGRATPVTSVPQSVATFALGLVVGVALGFVLRDAGALGSGEEIADD